MTEGDPLVAPRGPMRRTKLSDQIAGDLRRRIARDRLKPGDRLPDERSLTQHYGRAKGTIRDALKALETQGLVTVQPGPNGGTDAFTSRNSISRRSTPCAAAWR